MSDWVDFRHGDRPAEETTGNLYELQGLPLRRVDMAILLGEDDMGDGQFPPSRFTERLERQDAREHAKRGDFTRWSTEPNRFPVRGFAHIEAYQEAMTALLLAEEPGPDLPEDERKTLQAAVPLLVEDLLDHGTALCLGDADKTVEALPFSSCYPFEDGSWAVVEPTVSADANSSYPDQASVWVWELDGKLTQAIRRWSGDEDSQPVVGGYGIGNLEETLGKPTVTSGRPLAVGYMPPVRGGTGRSVTDALIPLAAEMALRHASLKSALREVEMPRLLILGALEDIKAGLLRPGEAQTTDTPSVSQIRDRLPSMTGREILVLDGVREVSWLALQADLSTSYDYLTILAGLWSEFTGLEKGSGTAELAQSGIAIALDNAMAIARAQMLHSAIRDIFVEARGGAELDWPAPGMTKMEDPGDPDEDPDEDPNPQPEVDAAPEPPGDPDA